METDHLMAIVNEIELNITEEMIEGANHKKTEQMLDNIVKNSDVNQVKEDLKFIQKTLRDDLFILVQDAAEYIEEGKIEDIFGSEEDDLLINISLLNKMIKYIESYISEFLNKHSLDESDIEQMSVESLSKPKKVIIDESVFDKLKKIPSEERHEFIKPYMYLIDGGGTYNKDVKHYSRSNDKKLAGVDVYRGYQARIYTYPVTKDIVYLFHVEQKKGDWPTDIRKSIAKRKPTPIFVAELKRELEDIEETKKKFSKDGEYYETQEELERIIGIEKEEESKIEIPRIIESFDVDFLRQDGLNIINVTLNSNYEMESIKSPKETKTAEEVILNRLYIYIDSIASEYEYSFEEYDDEIEVDNLIDNVNKLIEIEKIILGSLKDYYMNKSELDTEEELILKFETPENFDKGNFETTYQNNPISQKRGIIRREIRKVQKRIYYYLNKINKDIKLLKSIEYDMKMGGKIK